jgi:hypothetical protein
MDWKMEIIDSWHFFLSIIAGILVAAILLVAGTMIWRAIKPQEPQQPQQRVWEKPE